MTNAQKWVAAFLVLFLLLFALEKLTEEKQSLVSISDMEGYDISGEEIDVVTIMDNKRCISCHGSDFKGTPKGPSIIGVQKYWSKDELINYLRNPMSYGKGNRFEDYKKKYKSFMPSFDQTDTKTLGRIAEYVLQLK